MPMRFAMILRRATLVLVGPGSLAMDSPALVCSEYIIILCTNLWYGISYRHPAKLIASTGFVVPCIHNNIIMLYRIHA